MAVMEEKTQVTYRCGGILHGLHPCGRFYGAWTHSFSATFTEQACHGCLVGQREASSITIIGQLQSHLYVGIWRQAALLHEPLAVLLVHQYAQINLVDQLGGTDCGLLNLRQTRLEIPAKTRWRRWLELGCAFSITSFVISIKIGDIKQWLADRSIIR